jgi:tRNA-binding protein
MRVSSDIWRIRASATDAPTHPLAAGKDDVVAQHEIDPRRLPYAPERLELKPGIGIDGFFAVDMRAGRVVEVEPFPEARKPAWKITVDFGPVVGVLRSSAQITNYTAGELRGRLVVGALNLGRKRVAGFESEFLVLGALEPDGTVRLLELPEGVEPGAPIA